MSNVNLTWSSTEVHYAVWEFSQLLVLRDWIENWTCLQADRLQNNQAIYLVEYIF